MIDMGEVRQTPTANYTPALIRHSKIVLHRTEGPTAEGAVNWLARPTTRASAHLVSDGTGKLTYQMVPLQFRAWAQCNFNSECISIEYPGFTAEGVPDALLAVMARDTAWLLKAYALPCRHAESGEGDGFCSHHDLGQAGGGHTDICGVDDKTWRKLERGVQMAFDAFGDDPLPAWALHGVPNPHHVSLPAVVTPEPSHGGLERITPGDVDRVHPTVSGYPLGSIADWQYRLKLVGANPSLAIDNDEGHATRVAIGTFQKAEGMVVTNETNPATWAALVKATG